VNILRAYVHIGRLQPQIAVAFAAGTAGFLPIAGQASLMVEVEPGILINQAMECEPAAYIVLAANEVEKSSAITLVNCNEIGAVGRLSVSGTSSQIDRAAETAKAVLANI